MSITPTALDTSGAGFAIELNNHQVEIDGDYAATSRRRYLGLAEGWSRACALS